MTRRSLSLWALFGAFALAACSQTPAPAPQTCPTDVCPEVTPSANGAALSCIINGTPGPQTYLLDDYGKPGVPKLDRADVKQLENVRKFSKKTTLRFVVLGGKLAIFDGGDSPCDADDGFDVVNQCNARYDMVYAPNETYAGEDPAACKTPAPKKPKSKKVEPKKPEPKKR